jgi:hypothetical protein
MVVILADDAANAVAQLGAQVDRPGVVRVLVLDVAGVLEPRPIDVP